MSRAVAPAPARASAATPQAQRSAFRIGRAGDIAEVQADRAADQALSGANPSLPPAAGSDAGATPAPRALDARIAAARCDGRPLPAGQRDFFARRFGHDFRQVRIHDGPAAAAAARTAGAQAFTLGPDIFFGEGRHRPESAPGRELMAHELAHTLQSRPGVISRRALDVPPAADPDAAGPTTSPEAQDASDQIGDLIGGGADLRTPATRERLRGLSPESQGQALGRARARLPAGEAAKLDHAMTATAGPAPDWAAGGAGRGDQGPEIRGQGDASAPIAHQAGTTASVPSAHERALTASTATMQATVQGLRDGGATESPASAGPEGGESDAADGASTGQGQGEASAAMQIAVGRLNASRAQLGAVQALQVQFLPDDSQGPPALESAAKRTAGQSLASTFVNRTAQKVQALLAGAMAVPGRALATFNTAAQGIRASAVAQGAALKAGGQTARRKIRGARGAVHGAIAQGQAEADGGAEAGVVNAKTRAKGAHDKAAGGLAKRAAQEQARIGRAYRAATAPMKAVGDTAAQNAASAARSRSAKLLEQRNGESTVLDGPLHDDQLEASAEAGIGVAQEYGKSFQASAETEANKIPDSRGEVLGKVDEITSEARKGFSDQLRQIEDGASAQKTGAKAQSATAAGQMRGALDSSAGQSLASLDTAEAEQAAGLAQGAAAAEAGLDQAIAGSIRSFADGIGEAADGLTGSIGDFVASAAETPPPEPGELSQALAGAAPDSALADMTAQAVTVAPQLAAAAAETQKGSEATSAREAAAAVQGFETQATAFANGAGGIRRQATTGFQKLKDSTKTSTDATGKTAEDGFDTAVTNANAAYAQFGDQVEDNLRQGRVQMLDGLWGQQSRDKLQDDMESHGKKAAAEVKPRWKKVLKWVVTIVVIIAVIAITVLTAGGLGPVGVILLGAALGAAAGAVQTIAENLIDGKKWSDGVVKAMIVGAIGGAVGGAGGVLLKGVGSVALKIGLEAGINVVGGVAGEVIGSLATGQQVNWTGALMGALIGAGIGAGLGIAGALKGKIRMGGMGAGEGAAPVRPPVIEPPPSPSTGLRGALEKAKILAPKPGALTPPSVKPPELPAMGEPPAPAVPPKRPIGFRTGEPTVEPTVGADPAASSPKEPIGFKIGDKANAPAVDPMAQPAPPKPKEPIGFKIGDKANAPAVDPMAPPAPKPRRRIGFGAGEIIPEPGPSPSPTAAAAPSPPRIQTGGGPKAMVIEPSAPRMSGSGPEPVRAGGRSSIEPRASASSSEGAGRPAAGGVEVVEPQVSKPQVTEPAGAKPSEPAAAPEATAAQPEAVKSQTPDATPDPATPGSKRRIIGAGEALAEPAPAKPAAAKAKPSPSEPTNKPRRPQTGDEFEAAELLSDTSRPPKSNSYFDYQGGKNGSFYQFAKQFKAHLDAFGMKGSVPMNEAPLKMTTGEFINSRPNLKPRWMALMEEVSADLQAYRKNNPNYSKSDYYRELEAQLQELSSFGKGKVGTKRPDLVEIFPGSGQVEVTDITLKFGDRFHAFKTQFYTDLMDAMFPALKASGNEYGGPLKQRLMGPT